MEIKLNLAEWLLNLHKLRLDVEYKGGSSSECEAQRIFVTKVQTKLIV